MIELLRNISFVHHIHYLNIVLSFVRLVKYNPSTRFQKQYHFTQIWRV